MKRTIWRRAFEKQANERSKFWESVRGEDPLEPEDLELLFSIVKSFHRSTLFVEYFAGEDGFYVLETTKHHCQDHVFQELYEVRAGRVRRDHERVGDGAPRDHMEVYLFEDPQEFTAG